jgi:hypothetical protein
MLLDMAASAIDEMRIVDLDGTGGHARQAREAAIEVMDRLRIGRPASLQHGTDQVDAPARGIVLVPRQYIGRAGIGAEAIVYAGLENPVRLGNLGFRQLRLGKIGAHRGQTSEHRERLPPTYPAAIPRPHLGRGRSRIG